MKDYGKNIKIKHSVQERAEYPIAEEKATEKSHSNGKLKIYGRPS